ncbi:MULTISPECIES: hypothetical protein [unclassified Microcoleus]|uniref:hypothetical protein n=1 Tax=unclassified Microcoleus TaxID=2642155 RepID=UPI002FD01E80
MEKETGKIPGSLVALDDGIAIAFHRSQIQETRCLKQHQKSHHKWLPPPAAPNTAKEQNPQRRDHPQVSQSTSVGSKLLHS